MSLDQITDLARALRAERDTLAQRVQNLNDHIAQLNTRLLPGIRSCVNAAAAQHSLLHSAIDSSRHLFESPRSLVVHGFRIGLRKGSGGIAWDDADRVIDLIEKRLPEKADLLIKTKKRLDVRELDDLDVSDLKKIGCTVEETGDIVYIKPTDTAVDKIVKALLKSATDTAVEKAEAA